MGEEEKKAEPRRATHEELVAYLATHQPPEEFVLEVKFGAGADARVAEFRFRRSLAAFGRFTQLAYGTVDAGGKLSGGQPLAASLRFLLDSVVEKERATLTAWTNAYPIAAADAAAKLIDAYEFETVETRIKNS